MMVLGHVPLSVAVMINEAASSAQLSVALPPPARKSINVVNAGGILPLQSSFILPGHVITGGVVSATMIVCTHWAVLPHESAMEYVLTNVFGHVPDTDSLTANVDSL